MILCNVFHIYACACVQIQRYSITIALNLTPDQKGVFLDCIGKEEKRGVRSFFIIAF